MERVKVILKRIFFLPPLPTVLISVPSFALVIYVLVTNTNGPLAYAGYGLSAYAMSITTTGITRIIRAVRGGIGNNALVKKVRAHPVGGRLLDDAAFRAEMSIYPSLGINLFYAAFKLTTGILYSSVWLITLAVYYILLAVMRFLVLTAAWKRNKGADLEGEFRHYRLCGALLAAINLALSGMVLFLVRQEGSYDYPGMLIYVMAMYAFYAVITAVINIIKFKKHGSPTLSAAKAINLTAALVSMLALETAMLSQFGGEDDAVFRQVMLSVSGGVICAFVFGMAVYMIAHASKQIKSAKGASENGRQKRDVYL